MSLSGIGCGALMWIGWMDQRACEQLAMQEANLDMQTWLKLLFVPTLGIVILTLFVLEEYCSSSDSHKQEVAAHALQPNQAHHHHFSPNNAGQKQFPLKQMQNQQTLMQQQQQQLQHQQQQQLLESEGKISDDSSADSRLSHDASLSSPSSSSPLSSSTSSSHLTYPYPLTLLSLARTPQSSLDYPTISAAPLTSSSPATAASLLNPQDLLAGQSKSARHNATIPGIMAAQNAQVLLMGSPAVFPLSPSHAPASLRVNLMNEAGVSMIVTVPSNQTTMKELMMHYTQRNNVCFISHAAASSGSNGSTAPPSLSNSLFIFSYKGQQLTNDKATLAALGIGAHASSAECEVIHVRLNFEVLCENLKLETERESNLLHERLQASENQRDQAEKEWKKSMEKLDECTSAVSTLEKQISESQAEKSTLITLLETLKTNLVEEGKTLENLKQTKFQQEGSESDRIETKRLEKARNALKSSLDELRVEMSELVSKQTKVDKEQATLSRETTTVKEKTAAIEEEAVRLAHYASNDAGEPTLAPGVILPDGFVSIATLTAQLEVLERSYGECLNWRKKIDMIQNEIANKKAEIHILAKKVHMSDGLNNPNAASTDEFAANATANPNSKEFSLISMRARAAQLERDTKDLLRWKSIAKNLEMEAKECFRWKSLLRASASREKHLETSARESSGWRVRAKAFEKEARELRAFKRSWIGGSDASNASGGDFYHSAASTAGNGLVAYDAPEVSSHHSTLAGSSTSYGYNGANAEELELDHGERIEPLMQHARTAGEEEETEAAARAASAQAAAAAASHRHHVNHHEGPDIGLRAHMSDELAAAEAEEERLVSGLRKHSDSTSRQSPNSMDPTSSSSTMNAAESEEELFRLGEALVRRNQHLHQHRLMVRYQQQQMAGLMHHHHQHQHHSMHQQRSGNNTNNNDAIDPVQLLAQRQQLQDYLQQQQLNQQQQSSIGNSNLYTSSNKGNVTGVLQASAPVFTPRFNTDVNVPASSTISSHYTKISGNATNTNHSNPVSYNPSLRSSPQLGSISHASSPQRHGSPPANWNGSGNAVASQSKHADSASLDLDPSAYWSASLNNLLDDLESAPSSATVLSGGGTAHATSRGFHTRGRSFSGSSSQPSHSNNSSSAGTPAVLPPSHPSALTTNSVTSNSANTVNSSLLLSGMADPFNSFRRSANLTIIDDYDNVSSGGIGISALTSSTPPLGMGSAQLSRINSGASSPSAQLFSSGAASSPFFQLHSTSTGGSNQS